MILYKFFEDTLAGRFIKHLLRSECIPRFKVIQDEDYLIVDRCYLYQGMIIKCIKSGVFKHTPEDTLYPSSHLYPSIDIYPGLYTTKYNELILGRYICLKYYDSADMLAQYNYHSKHLWHDSDTHYHLGEYLRYLKAEKGLNLLPYYNCFNYKSTLNLKSTDNVKIRNDKKYLLVPVKFNRTYTIALNSKAAFQIQGILYNDFLGNYYLTPSKLRCNNATFNSPFIFTTCNPIEAVENNEIETGFHERDFHLLFELDSDNETGLVVLEGDYRNSTRDVITSYPHMSTPANLSLLKVDNGISYAYSSRLVEYLLHHVICDFDQVSDNIRRVQEQLVKLNIKQPFKDGDTLIFDDYYSDLYTGNASFGIWDDKLKAKLNIYIDHLLQKGHPLVDQDGNVNSQLEEYLRRGVV